MATGPQSTAVPGLQVLEGLPVLVGDPVLPPVGPEEPCDVESVGAGQSPPVGVALAQAQTELAPSITA